MGSKGPYDWPLHHGTARATRSGVFENPSGYDGPHVIGIGPLFGGRPVANCRTPIPVRPRRSPRFDRESATVWTDVILYVVRRLAAQTDVRTPSLRRLRPLLGSQSREREKTVDRRCPIHTVPYDGSDLKMWAFVLHGARRDVVAPRDGRSASDLSPILGAAVARLRARDRTPACDRLCTQLQPWLEVRQSVSVRVLLLGVDGLGRDVEVTARVGLRIETVRALRTPVDDRIESLGDQVVDDRFEFAGFRAELLD